MSVVKPAVAGNPSIVVSANGIPFQGKSEIVAFHYLNTTAGAGRVDIYDGQATVGNLRVSLGSDAANGNDDWCPAQPQKFNQLNVVFATGTGVLSILSNS